MNTSTPTPKARPLPAYRLTFDSDELHVEVYGANILQALGHLEGELCNITGHEACLSDDPVIAGDLFLRDLDDTGTYRRYDFADPECNFTLRLERCEDQRDPVCRECYDVESHIKG